MRLVRLLPERWQKFLREAAKFGIVGGVNTVINYAVFNALALTVFVDGQLKATVVATIVATITSYLMNRHWTYRDRPKSTMRREYALFFLFNATGLLIELGVLALAKYGFGVTSLLALNIAKTGGVVLATLFRFWSYRTFVFQPAPEPAKAGKQTDDPLTELDPVADLAGSMAELDEAQPPKPAVRAPRARPSSKGPRRPKPAQTPAAQPHGGGAAARGMKNRGAKNRGRGGAIQVPGPAVQGAGGQTLSRNTPVEDGLTDTGINTELHAATRRATGR